MLMFVILSPFLPIEGVAGCCGLNDGDGSVERCSAASTSSAVIGYEEKNERVIILLVKQINHDDGTCESIWLCLNHKRTRTSSKETDRESVRAC